MPLKTINLRLVLTPETKKNLLILAVSLFLGLVWMMKVSYPGTGLDPSWSLGLTKAHEEGLYWGKDVIFTYGSFGYLFIGDLIGKNFWEMQISRYILSASSIFFALNYIAAQRERVIKFVGLICLVLVPSLHLYIRWEVSFWILIQLAILDLANSYKFPVKNEISNLKIYSYGVFGIFLLLVKFSFGFAAVVGFTLVSLFELGWRLCQTRVLDLTVLQRFNWLLFGYLSGLLVFFSPLAATPEVAIITVFSLGGLTSLLLRHTLPEIRKFLKFKVNQKRVFLLVLLGLLVLISVNSALRDFILGSFQIASGYSTSMSMIGNPVELQIGFVIFSIMIFLGIVAIAVDPRRNTGVTLALLGLVLINFKHGFIRHDIHVLWFALATPSFLFNLGMLSMYSSASNLSSFLRTTLRVVWLAAVSFTIIFALQFGLDNPVTNKHYNLSLKSYVQNIFDPRIVYEKASLLIQSEKHQNQISSIRKDTLRPSQISSPLFLSHLLNQSVEVVPWEISITEANQLKWHPAPIFQAYSAYTSWLDKRNLSYYQTKPPEKIIYNHSTVDGRHFYFEQPLTTLFRLCNYTYLKLPSQSLDSVGNIAILSKRKIPLCRLENITPVGQPMTLKWEQSFELEKIRSLYSNEPGNMLLIQAKIEYSVFGKLYNFLLRTPPIYLQVTYENGQITPYRMMINNVRENTIIGSLPTNFNEFMQDFDGKDSSNPVKRISVFSPNQAVFLDGIKLQFSRLKKQVELPEDFDPEQYLKLNPDVKRAGIDPGLHFSNHGFFEGRAYR